ncbi:hypothetical protein NQ652_17830, partial [Acinetobacter baumannii]|nr:hypothetical protein [Acinetobacter baumannii]
MKLLYIILNSLFYLNISNYNSQAMNIPPSFLQYKKDDRYSLSPISKIIFIFYNIIQLFKYFWINFFNINFYFWLLAGIDSAKLPISNLIT